MYWGPKPFRFNNCWLDHKKLKGFLDKEWKSLEVKGRGNFVLKEKLKSLNKSLKIRNVEVFGWLNLKVDESVKELNDLDVLLLDFKGCNSVALIERRAHAIK